MNSLWKMTWMEVKLFLREPIGAFFTLAFPLGMLFLFGSIYGNEPAEIFGGRGTIDISVPAYTAMIIATTSLMGLNITISSYRENGVLRRLRTTPISPLVIMVAEVVVLFVMTTLGMLLLVVAGVLVYHLRFEGNVLSVLAGFVLSLLSMLISRLCHRRDYADCPQRHRSWAWCSCTRCCFCPVRAFRGSSCPGGEARGRVSSAHLRRQPVARTVDRRELGAAQGRGTYPHGDSGGRRARVAAHLPLGIVPR